eukprot:Lithocolla_globosa_v1_NODE_279_length_4683_cov_29.291919.p2 type:complete len:110 gc:universal NODE_279_length_4683_cov_29.291919:1568-1239(-)
MVLKEQKERGKKMFCCVIAIKSLDIDISYILYFERSKMLKIVKKSSFKSTFLCILSSLIWKNTTQVFSSYMKRSEQLRTMYVAKYGFKLVLHMYEHWNKRKNRKEKTEI